MTSFTRIIGAAALLGGVAAPAAAQYAYPQQSYPQYPQYPQQNYPGYGYGQGTTGNPITDIVDQLLGNRYNVTDRQAVRQCANAAMSQASALYNGYNQNQGAYGQRYNNGYNNGAMRVTSITSVERRNNGLRVSGMMSSGGRYNTQGYNNRGYGYNNQGYGQQLSFRCNVDYRGAVTGLRVRPAR
jgi:hypothetical protein